MKPIKTIKDIDFGLDFRPPAIYKERQASRAIVFDKDNNIAPLHVTKKSYYKLPGGGVERGENLEAALRRELIEEIGCSIGNIQELGIIEEYRNKYSVHQLSHCFIGNLFGEKGAPHLEKDEVEDGFETIWLRLEDAVKTLEAETDIQDYEGKFIQARELTFLKEASKLR